MTTRNDATPILTMPPRVPPEQAGDPMISLSVCLNHWLVSEASAGSFTHVHARARVWWLL